MSRDVGRRVSVVIPVRDDAVAARALPARCWPGRPSPPDEVVVVDNASTDDSAAVARRAGARVVPEPRLGIPHAAATGYDAARGDVIARLRRRLPARAATGWRGSAAAMADPRLDAVTGTGSFHDLPPVLRPLADARSTSAPTTLLTHLALGHTAAVGLEHGGAAHAAGSGSATRCTATADVHDDLDLAFVLGPQLGDPAGARARRRRLRRARCAGWPSCAAAWTARSRTLRLNWADQPAVAALARPVSSRYQPS